MGDILRLIEASLNTRNEDLDEVFRAFETRFINGDPPMFTRYESRGTPYAYWFWFCVVDFIKQYKPKGKPAESEGISPPKKNEKAPVKPANIHSEAKKWDATLKKEGLGIIHPSKRSFGPSLSREKREDTIVADRQAIQRYKTVTAQADFILAQPNLTKWEKDFASNIRHKYRERSSDRQMETLLTIFQKYQAKRRLACPY
jgi:hypothetical protein